MKSSSQSVGFSLLELCIAVAIIAVLVALSVPAVNNIRERAGITACLGNLRNWGAAIAAYTADQNGLLPQNEYPKNPDDPSSPTNQLFFHALAPYGGYVYPVTNRNGFRKSMLACPAETELPKTFLYNYAMNVDLNYRIQGTSNLASKTKVRLQNLENASTYVLMSDSYESCVFYTHTKAKMESFTNAFRRHRGIPNFLYADGHVQPSPAPLAGFGDSNGMTPLWKNMWFANGLEPAKR